MKALKFEDVETNLSGYTYYARVPWGWVLYTVDEVATQIAKEGDLHWGMEWRGSNTFIFDPFHWWRDA